MPLWFFANAFAVELIVSLFFFVVYRPRRNKFVLRVALGVTAYFLLVNLTALWMEKIADSVFSLGGLFFFLTALFLVFYVWFAYEIDFTGALYFVTAAYVVQHTGYSLAKIFRTLYAGVLNEWLELVIADFMVYIVLGGIIFFTIVHPRRRTFNENLHNRRALAFSLTSLVLCVLLNAWAESIYLEHPSPYMDELRFVCSEYSIVGCVSAIFLQFGFIRESRLASEKKILDQLLIAEKKQHELSRAAIEIINEKSHDLKHQIALLANIDDKKAREEYIEEVKKHVSVYDSDVMTGCPALDIILSEKELFCERNNIALSYLADGKRLAFMSSADIASLFGNALDNAIERSLREREDCRFISIAVRAQKGFVYIHMDNYCSRKVEFADGLPLSDKGDGRYHGFGAKSMRTIVEKYGGDMYMEVKENRFNTDIFFPLPEDCAGE